MKIVKIVLWIFFVMIYFSLDSQSIQDENALRNRNLIVCGDTTICEGESVNIWASGASFYEWYPITGLSSSTISNPIASPINTITYYITGYYSGTESVFNGNFEQGNTGFTTQYTYNSNLYGEGTYYVGADASNYHPNFVGHDHTTGNGNFMIVNGYPGTNVTVWSQVIDVLPNTEYSFSTWVSTLAGNANEVAQLQFSINGVQLGSVFSAPTAYNTWIQFYQIWNSGENTQATITILNQNTLASGNDFGLDDISFVPIVGETDSVTVYVNNTTGDFIFDTACYGIPYTENGFNIPNPQLGAYTHYLTFENYAGCDSLLVLSLVTLPLAATSLNDTVCFNEPYTQNGFNFVATHDTVITQFLPPTDSCRSVTLHLKVNPAYLIDTIVTICAGESFTGFGFENLTESNIYTHTSQTTEGCDSSVILRLTVADPTVFNISGGGSDCSNETAFAINIDDSEQGVPYHIFCNNNFVETIIGTGEAMTLGTYSQRGVYTVQSVINNQCSEWMNGSVVIKTTPTPPERIIQHD